MMRSGTPVSSMAPMAMDMGTTCTSDACIAYRAHEAPRKQKYFNLRNIMYLF